MPNIRTSSWPGHARAELPPWRHGWSQPAAPRPDALTLVCYGQGEHAVYSSDSGYHSGLNRLTVEIDRRSGFAEIKGRPGFSGKCDVGDWGASRRF